MIEIEQTTVKINIDKKLNLGDAQAVRGFFGCMYANRPELYGKDG